MNFFERQEKARKRTGYLVFLFMCAVGAIVVMVNLAFVIFISSTNSARSHGFSAQSYPPEIFGIITAATLLLILASALFRIFTLRDGGRAIARTLGANPVPPDTKDPDLKRLLNVVQEMAIASGTPVPEAYVLQELSINALAAGYSIKDAAIVVNEGTVRKLSRDELQGVIAHEFSHIFNGDMRFNVKLIGILAGITTIGSIGRSMLNTRGSSRSSRGNSAVLFGLALLVIGLVGLFFGKLIRAAISRQREFLADASAVQFTRNPQGIGGALRKIKQEGTAHPMSRVFLNEVSHFFFSDAFQKFSSGLLSTHPPIDERIQAIEGRGVATESAMATATTSTAHEQASHAIPEKLAAVAGFASPGDSTPPPPRPPEALIKSIGNPGQAHMEYAHDLIARIPAEIIGKTESSQTVPIVLYALMLSPDSELRARQLELIRQSEAPQLATATDELNRLIAADIKRFRLPLIELCMPVFRQLSTERKKTVLNHLKKLIECDQRVELHEFVSFKLISAFSGFMAPSASPKTCNLLRPMITEIRQAMSFLAYVGSGSTSDAIDAFTAGIKYIFPSEELPIAERSECDGNTLNQALDRLNSLAPKLKSILLGAFARCALADATVTTSELEVLRMISVILECPMPPVLSHGRETA